MIFYNNDGRQVGTYDAKRTKTNIYNCEKGLHPIISHYGTAYKGSTTSANNVIYITGGDTVGSGRYGFPSNSSATNYQVPFYSLDLNLSITSIDYISVNGRKFKILKPFTRDTSATSATYSSIGDGYISKNTDSDFSRPIYLNLVASNKTSMIVNKLILTILAYSSDFNYYQGANLASDMPIKISTYVDESRTIL